MVPGGSSALRIPPRVGVGSAVQVCGTPKLSLASSAPDSWAARNVTVVCLLNTIGPAGAGVSRRSMTASESAATSPPPRSTGRPATGGRKDTSPVPTMSCRTGQSHSASAGSTPGTRPSAHAQASRGAAALPTPPDPVARRWLGEGSEAGEPGPGAPRGIATVAAPLPCSSRDLQNRAPVVPQAARRRGSPSSGLPSCAAAGHTSARSQRPRDSRQQPVGAERMWAEADRAQRPPAASPAAPARALPLPPAQSS